MFHGGWQRASGANTYVATLDSDDPLVIANHLIDRALTLQDEGRMDEAEDLLNAADQLLA